MNAAASMYGIWMDGIKAGWGVSGTVASCCEVLVEMVNDRYPLLQILL